MTYEQIAAILGPAEFSVGQRVKVYPHNTHYEPEPGIVGRVAAVYVTDDHGTHDPADVEEVDNDRLGSVWYYGVDFAPDDPMLAESDPHGGYYEWELEDESA